MFNLDLPISKGEIRGITIRVQPLRSVIEYYVGFDDGEFVQLGGSHHLNVDQDGTIELLQAIQQTTDLQQIKQALEDFLVTKLQEEGK